nr:DEAD/DEAH box helicase [Phycisphaerales bacterium]
MLTALLADPLIHRLAREALRAARLTLRGHAGASTTHLAAALHRRTERPLLLVVAHVDDADSAVEELTAMGVHALAFPALETLPGESGIALDALAERLTVVRALASGAAEHAAFGGVIVAPIAALMQAVPAMASLAGVLRTVRVGESIAGGPTRLSRWLDGAGYERVTTIEEPGQFAIRGGIVDIFPPGDPGISSSDKHESLGGVPVRLDFFGDEVEKLHEVDLASMGLDRAIKSVQLVCAKAELIQSDRNTVQLASLLPTGTLCVLAELMEITEQGRGYFERVLNSAGIFGPPAVMSEIGRRCSCTIEVGTVGVAGAHVVELPVRAAPSLSSDVGQAIGELARLATDPLDATEIEIVCASEAERARLLELLTLHTAAIPHAQGKIRTDVRYVHQGFIWDARLHEGAPEDARARLLLPYAELLHRFSARRGRGRGGGGRGGGGQAPVKLRAGRAMDTFLELQVGDYVVHQEHGIARFVGLVWLKPRDVKRSIDERLTGLTATASSDEEPLEHLVLEFDGGAKLYVPATKVDLVNKYVGGFRGKPPLSTLGGERWKNQKQRTSEAVRDLAAEMLRVRAAREQLPGIRYPGDTDWQKRFEDEFPHQETDDQIAALSEIKKDMSSPRPMDRLLCGDVGFGKTEMAVRAAFKAAEFGKQVAVLVPTTVLAEQHERTFKGRFADYPFRVESISRFKSGSEEKRILEELAQGRVDIIIGTHRILSKDVRFADLGLVVIDEEQRFGVEHKERLLSLRMTADILTLSATPIPRTLHMSMLGLRDISSLTTAPLDRRAVVTEVIPKNPARLKQVIDRELAREGQVFYVHNRVHDIQSVADDVQRLAPNARIVIGHGQMSDGELERVILTFVRGQADILVSTTIIESGIDIARANTMIIEDADRFGLAELHQLR